MREHISAFINTLKGAYFEKLVGSEISNFLDLIITGCKVEDAIGYEKLTDNFARAIESQVLRN